MEAVFVSETLQTATRLYEITSHTQHSSCLNRRSFHLETLLERCMSVVVIWWQTTFLLKCGVGYVTEVCLANFIFALLVF